MTNKNISEDRNKHLGKIDLHAELVETGVEQVLIDLDKSFRFTQPILDVSSRFIQKNPLQLKKNITSKPSLHKKTVEIIENEFGNENYFYVTADRDGLYKIKFDKFR